MWSKFCTNPTMFKILYINNERIDTTRSSTSVLGNAVHAGLKAFLGGDENYPIMHADTDQERLKYALDATMACLAEIPDGFIDWKSSVPTRARLEELALRSVPAYVREWDRSSHKTTLIVEKKLESTVRVQHGKKEIELPVPMICYPDHVYEDQEGRVCIDDHKTTFRYSDPDAIDGAKLIQAAMEFFLVAMETGKTPYKITFREFKVSENADKSAQTREFVMYYHEMQIIFDLFFRLYDDITRALLGEMVYVPNIMAMFDRDVALMAYIFHLDDASTLQKEMKRSKAADVAALMQKKMSRTKNLKRFMEAKASLFTSSVSLNYSTMSEQEKIKYKFFEHGIPLDFADKIEGLSVDLYRFRPTMGVKMTTLEKYSKDVAQVLAASNVRILAPIPETDMIGFEVPKKKRAFIDLKDAVGTTLDMPIGVDVYGKAVSLDVRKWPHILVAGTTGSGKSSFINASLTYLTRLPLNEISFVLIDPKMVELSAFQDDKHTEEYREDPIEILHTLESNVAEMNARYAIFKTHKVKSLDEYRMKIGTNLPYKLIVIDEFADLILGGHTLDQLEEDGKKKKVTKVDVSAGIKKCMIVLAAKARAAGIHLMIATQRPSAKVVDGLIKANFPTRIAFQTTSRLESEIILDRAGAELLLGQGDMLLSNGSKVTRLQGYRV